MINIPNAARGNYNPKTPGEIAFLERKQMNSGKKLKRYEYPIEVKPDGSRIFARDDKGKPICNGLLRDGSGKRCVSPFILHNGRCKRHHGRGETAINNRKEKQKHGAYHKLPKHLLDNMDRAAKQPDPLSLLDDINFCTARIEELSSNLDTIPPAHLMEMMLKQVVGLMDIQYSTEDFNGEEVLRGKTLKSFFQKVQTLFDTVERASKYRHNVNDLMQVQRQKSALAETEIRKRIADGNMMPTEQVAALCVQLTDIFLGIMKDAREVHEASTRLKQWQHKALSSGPMANLVADRETQYGASGAKSPEEIREMAKFNKGLDETPPILDVEFTEDGDIITPLPDSQEDSSLPPLISDTAEPTKKAPTLRFRKVKA